jgi:hypothetical protein
MTENLFDTNQDDQVQIDPSKNYLEELVGEGKKFKTPEELARGKFHSDHLIELQNRRMDELRADHERLLNEYKSRASLEEMIQNFTNKNTDPTANNQAQFSGNTQQPAFKPEDIEDLVLNKITQHEQSRIEENNFNSFKAKLTEKLGPNYQNYLREQTNSLGMSDDMVNSMARRSPQALIKMLGLDQQANQNNVFEPPARSLRNDPPSRTEKRTWSYYQKMKRERPDEYRKAQTQTQMQRDYLELGQDFEDGDFRH